VLPAGFCLNFYRTTKFSILALSRFCFSGRQKSDGEQTSSFAIFGVSFGLCELQMCLAVWADAV